MADTFTYFNGRGAGEVIRLIYAAAGKGYKDNRVEQADWPKIKQDMPMKALPVLEIKGKKHCQSGAIARYLAKKNGLFGSSDEEGLDIDEVYECVQDAIREMYKFVFEKDENKKAEAMKKFTDETLPKLNDYFVYKCKANKSKKGFIVGDKLTLADIIFFAFVDNVTLSGHGEIWKKFPEIEKHQKLIASQENIKAWVAKRPKTQF